MEQYKSYEVHRNSGKTIDKNTCESIIIKEDYKKKCQFNEGTNSALRLKENALTLKLIL